jgi:hypothetical protein
MKRLLIIAGVIAGLLVAAPAQADASNWIATRAEAESWILNKWPNVTDVRCYGRDFAERRAGRKWYGWFSCATGFKTKADGHWYEVARVTPISRHSFRYRTVKVID